MKRRNLLRGLGAFAGLGAAGAIARHTVRSAFAQDRSQLRFLFVSTTNGWWPWANCTFAGDHDDALFFRRDEDGKTRPREQAGSLSRERVETTDLRVPNIFAPLSAHTDRMLFVDGLAQRSNGPVNAHSKGAQLFNGANFEDITVDQWLATGLAGSSPYDWIGLGAGGRSSDVAVGLNSIDAEGGLVPFITSPSVAYQNYFSTLGEPSLPVARALGPSLVTSTSESIRSARGRLAASERPKFDEYLVSIEELDRSFMAAPAAVECSGAGIDSDPPNARDRFALQYQLAATALGCGLSRVAFLCFGGAADNAKFNFDEEVMGDITGDDAESLHGVGHFSPSNFNEQSEAYHAFHSNQLARAMDQLAATPSANGRSALDDTIVVYLNDNGIIHHYGAMLRYPVAIFGDAGGQLRADGRYLRYAMHEGWHSSDDETDAPAQGTLQQLWNTLAHVAGAPRDDFGAGERGIASREQNRGVLDDLLR
ncbi:MAG: DUF1552 domain-containing protein [Myxococcota bacterium]